MSMVFSDKEVAMLMVELGLGLPGPAGEKVPILVCVEKLKRLDNFVYQVPLFLAKCRNQSCSVRNHSYFIDSEDGTQK